MPPKAETRAATKKKIKKEAKRHAGSFGSKHILYFPFQTSHNWAGNEHYKISISGPFTCLFPHCLDNVSGVRSFNYYMESEKRGSGLPLKKEMTGWRSGTCGFVACVQCPPSHGVNPRIHAETACIFSLLEWIQI